MPLPIRSRSVREPQHGVSRTRLPQAGITVRGSEGLNSATNEAPLAPSFVRPVTTTTRGTGAEQRAGHVRTGSLTTSRIPQSLHQPHNSTRQLKAGGDGGVITNSTSGKHAQQIRLAASATSHMRSQSQSSSSVKSRVPSTSSSGQRALTRPRPHFDNFQQHFSPKKPLHQQQTRNPTKPAGGATRDDAPRNAEAQGMQDELLQVSLVHEQASRFQGTFEATARRKLENLRSSVSKRHAEVADLEKQYQRHQNLEAVNSWLHVDEHTAASDKVCSLSVCIAEINQLTSDGSTIDRLLQMFDVWRAKAERSLCQQQTDTDNNIDFIEPMDRELLAGLSLAHERLTVCRRTLASLGGADRASSLGRVVEGHTSLVEVLLEEIETYQNLHTSMLRQQEVWIAASIASIINPTETIKGDGDPAPRRGIWESLIACD